MFFSARRVAIGIRRSFSSTATSGNDIIYDVAVIGGGIVGLSTAREILARSKNGLRVCVMEKEAEVAQHQSLNNSGVIHAGIYYPPGSYRARLCVEGADLMYQFCREHSVPFTRNGKVIVATDPGELPQLKKIYQTARQNGVDVRMLDSAQKIREFEPNVQGVQAIFSPNSGCTDFRLVAEKLSYQIQQQQPQVPPQDTIRLNFEVSAIEHSNGSNNNDNITIRSSDPERAPVVARRLVVCAGLHSDRLAQMAGGAPSPTVIPVRGEWRTVRLEHVDMVNSLVYPVPDPRYPYLGVHFTRRVSGDLWIGPNAVLATAREGYSKTDVSFPFLSALMQSGPARSFLLNNSLEGLAQFTASLTPNSIYTTSLQKFIPSFRSEFLGSVVHAGVRALALDDDGQLIDDFVFERPQPNVLCVRNAPSPAATASLAIAREICQQLDIC